LEATAGIAAHIRSIRPHVVVTFGPDGGYGHPDHVAVSQLTAAALLRACDAGDAVSPLPPHRVSKLYYIEWPRDKWETYQATFKRLRSVVDGVERMASPWPDWMLTTVLDTASDWPTVWAAIQCHKTQLTIYAQLAGLPEDRHRTLWGSQEFYRVLSLVNGGRGRETDLFEGLR
jgi:LmbE family N-acetylglucosaminyl deacetylase